MAPLRRALPHPADPDALIAHDVLAAARAMDKVRVMEEG
jgi:hypothetical protein